MYTVFICRKCGHNLYAEETPDFVEKLGRICVMDCPNCGEEGYDNWILSCRKREFPGSEEECSCDKANRWENEEEPEMLECCQDCSYQCKQFDNLTDFCGCSLADREMFGKTEPLNILEEWESEEDE